MITNSNQVCFVELVPRDFQEALNNFLFSNFFKEVDDKNWRLHLLLFNRGMLQESKSCDRNHQAPDKYMKIKSKHFG